MIEVSIAVDGFDPDDLEKIQHAVQDWDGPHGPPNPGPLSHTLDTLESIHIVTGWPKPLWLFNSRVEFFSFPVLVLGSMSVLAWKVGRSYRIAMLRECLERYQEEQAR